MKWIYLWYRELVELEIERTVWVLIVENKTKQKIVIQEMNGFAASEKALLMCREKRGWETNIIDYGKKHLPQMQWCSAVPLPKIY